MPAASFFYLHLNELPIISGCCLYYPANKKNRARTTRALFRGVASNYLAAGPIIASMVPAATAVPITPATFGPIACMSRKFAGLAC